MTAVGNARFDRLNALAGLFALALFAALGVAWWRERAQHYVTPRWQAVRFESLAAAEPGSNAELWVVAVNLDCPHCQQHLLTLSHQQQSC